MIRLLYEFVLHLHPPKFRDRFEVEMLATFDDAAATMGAARLMGDVMISLARQWICRPHHTVNSLRLASLQTPCLYLTQHEPLSPSAHIVGVLSALLLLATVQFAVSHWSRPVQTMAGILRVGRNAPHLPQLQVPGTTPLGKPPTFEVISIRTTSPNHADGPTTVGMAPAASVPGRIRYPIITPRWLVSAAYGIPATQVEGPEWMNSEYFEVNATMPVNTPPDQIQLMLQNLLAERFDLKIHRETRTRQTPVFSLTLARGGSKLKASKKPAVPVPDNARSPLPPRPLPMDADGFAIVPPPPPGYKTSTYSESVNGILIKIGGQRQTMPELAASLGRVLKGTVKDATGLMGEYDVMLTFSKEDLPPVDSWPDIFDAVQSQLGLKLERTGTVPMDTIFLVVDHMERQPSEN